MEQYETKRGTTGAGKTSANSFLLAITFLQNADPVRFSGLHKQLKNSILFSNDNYPNNPTAAYDVLCNYSPPTSTPTRNNSRDTVNVSFAQANMVCSEVNSRESVPPTPGSNGAVFPQIYCYNCNIYGHIGRFCSLPDCRGVQAMQVGVSLTQVNDERIQYKGQNVIFPLWLILDSGSTVSSIKSKELLTYIKQISEVMRV